MESQYDRLVRLLKECTDKINKLGRLLKEKPEKELTREQQRELEIVMLKFMLSIKEFNK